MVELNNIWQDVQRGPPDPFLVCFKVFLGFSVEADVTLMKG